MRRRSKAGTAVVLPLAAAAIGCCLLSAVAAVGDAEAQTVQPHVIWSGSDSAISQREYLRVTSEREWKSLWQRHSGVKYEHDQGHRAPGIPIIDFEGSMIVAVFGGKAMCTRGVRALSVTEDKESLRLRFRGQLVGCTGDHPTTPYMILVLPRTTKPVDLEEQGANDANGNVTWHLVGRLDALE